MRAPARDPEEAPTRTAAPIPRRGLPNDAAVAALMISAMALLALVILVATTDPGVREQELAVGLLLVVATGLSASTLLIFGRKTASPVADTLRALRRGLLFGLACGGAAVLQLNGALNAGSLAFLLVLLAIVEMIFLARRQHPA